MKRESREILIQSILGGQAEFENFAQADQFLDSYGIDPEQDTLAASSKRSSGYLRPTQMASGSTGTTAGYPLWIVPNPKTTTIYVYDSVGSLHTKTVSGSTLTGLKDMNDAGTATGNGLAYYDNYIYGATGTTIFRYGPLNGTPSLTQDYWVSVLGKTQLTDTSYPNGVGPNFPNHPMKVINGKLLIGDVVGNQGVIHYIKTRKTTVEGDTDDGSTFNAIDFPYGYWPISIEKYGESAAIALYEGTNSGVTRKSRAAVVFWDTVNPTNYDRTIKDEFPDPFIGALYNANGILYSFSGEAADSTVRIMRLTGGYSFEQVQYIQQANVPYPGAVDGLLNKIYFGSSSASSISPGPRVFSIGMENRPLGNQVFTPIGLQGSESGMHVTALKFTSPGGMPDIGFLYNIGFPSGNYVPAKWRSQTYRIGKKFQVTKIRIPLAQAMASNMSLAVNIYADEDRTTPIYTRANITSTAYPNGERNIVLRPEGVTGWHSMNLDLEWLGDTSTLLTVGLPIAITYETFED